MSLFQVQTFTTLLSTGNSSRLSEVLAQFFALNPNLTVVDLHFAFRRQGQRAQRLTHLVYNTTPAGQTALAFPGGTRYYAAEWADTPSGQRAGQKAAAFFSSHPQFTPVLSRFLPPEANDQAYLFRRGLLVIYTAKATAFAVNAPQVVAAQPPALAVGAVSRAGILGDATAYPQVVMNVGGDAWPAGAPAPAVKQVDGGLLCHWAGIAPWCYAPETVPANSTTTPPTIVPCESTTTTPPPVTFTTTTTAPPPPGQDCCLRAAWDCVWNSSLLRSEWLLDIASVECLPAEACAPYPVETCA